MGVSFVMAKYSFEFKMQIIKDYLSGNGYRYLSRKYGLERSIIRNWIANYKQYGEEGLLRSRNQQVFTFEFKLHVVELYLTSEYSYRQLALKVGMTDPATIARWVREYRTAGPEALKPKKKGRRRTMNKEEINRTIENGDSDKQKELLKQLQEENLRLRIENAFLKEARRLRLEEEALQKKQRELSTVSEESSD